MSECAYSGQRIDTVNNMVLSHKGALKCNKPRIKLQVETGKHHSPVYNIIHQDFQLKCVKKRRVQELTTATMCISQTCRTCYKVE